MPDPTKVATKAADKVLSSADFCNGLQPGIGPRRRCWLVAPRQRSNRTQRMYRKFSVKVPVLLGLICFVTVFTWVAGIASPGEPDRPDTYVPRPPGTLSFNKDVAPILFENCAACHRPGRSGPFSLLTYADARKHAKQMAEVTQRRYMPPWLPEPGYGEFTGERRLGPDQIGVLQQWAAEGAPEGLLADLPPMPQWTEGWQLGVPDLIVHTPEAHTLPADGKDVYRNFVIPIPVATRRYVKAVEFLPGNWKVVHHAFINVDETGMSRRLAQEESPPGFDGMALPDTPKRRSRQ